MFVPSIVISLSPWPAESNSPEEREVSNSVPRKGILDQLVNLQLKIILIIYKNSNTSHSMQLMTLRFQRY